MTPRSRFHPRAVRLFFLLASVWQAACVTPTPITGGSIPPSAFHFTNTIPYVGPDPGGWKVAQVNIMLIYISPIQPEGTWCDVEVGVPEVNKDGPVSDAKARIESAVAADLAAKSTLQERLPTATLCQGFRDQMGRNLREPLKGSKVSKFITVGVPRTRYPEEE
jgi:hypothetical protein